MIPKLISIPIKLADEEIELKISCNDEKNIIEYNLDAYDNAEAPVQIKEGCFYEYEITKGYKLQLSQVVSQNNLNKSSGRIEPNIYVGTLTMEVLNKDETKCAEVKLEVQSVKTSYREDYRFMLEEITEKCTDLLLLHSSPVSQTLDVDFEKDAKTLYQRFAFIKSIIESVEFNDAVHKILISPVATWVQSEVVKDIRAVRKFGSHAVRQLVSVRNRTQLPTNHHLQSKLKSIPSRIVLNHKTESLDTPENRFIKHALTSFQAFCSQFSSHFENNTRTKIEVDLLVGKLEGYLSHSIFKQISNPVILPLNSPILQRREGYREILRTWLMFDLAAKLIWKGGDDVYSANKRDVATLYEYWLFFTLLDLIKEVFHIQPRNLEELIVSTKGGLGLQLQQGKHLAIKGTFLGENRKLNIEFSYNRTFRGKQDYPHGGSWTKNMRPDYTLSIWPYGIDAMQAEKEELIVHVHFDAKYKVEKLIEILGDDKEFDEDKNWQKKGTYKRADLLKMHAYKDAIRRTAGAYVLYPGTNEKYEQKGFHELIPGLGAFAIRPSKSNNGTELLKNFLHEIVNHFMNRASQRENISLKTYQVYKDSRPRELKDQLPEFFGNKRIIPDETYVLVGFYRPIQYDWIENNNLYNFRMGSGAGSLPLDRPAMNAQYLLLHTTNNHTSGDLWKIKSKGPRVFSKKDLLMKDYPNPSEDFYLVFEIEKVQNLAFLGKEWNFKMLLQYKKYRGSSIPFTCTMTELMEVKV